MEELQTQETQTEETQTEQTQTEEALTPQQATKQAPEEERTFSQRDVNRIVNKRLAEEKSKAEALFAQRECALARKELRMEAADMLRQRHLPAVLAELLDYEDRERCAASLAAVEIDFQAAVREGIHQALRGLGPPKDGANRRDPGAAVRGAMGLR